MGGGRKYLYPKWVWTPAGGWWHKAGPNARVYQGAWIFFTVTSSYFFYNYAERNTKYFFPKESIPRELPESMKGHGHH